MKKQPTHTKKRGLRVPFFVLLSLLVLFGIYVYWDNHTIETEEVSFVSAHLPPAFDGFRIAEVADLHNKQFGRNNEDLIQAVAETEPDIIAVTGDLVDEHGTLEDVLPAMAGFADIAPTYYVTGNHEWAAGHVPELMERLPELGVTCLENEAVSIHRGEEAIVVAGVHDPNGHKDQKTPADVAANIGKNFGDPFWILLAHRNTLYETYGQLGADLVITGHSHGGVIRLPFIGGLASPGHTLHPKWTAGFFYDFESPMYVSRGLGNTRPTFRIFNRCHLPVITMHCA